MFSEEYNIDKYGILNIKILESERIQLPNGEVRRSLKEGERERVIRIQAFYIPNK